MHSRSRRHGGTDLTTGMQWMDAGYVVMTGRELEFSKGKTKKLEEKLREPVQPRDTQRDLNNVDKSLMGGEEGSGFFSVVPSDRTGVSGNKLKYNILSEHKKYIFIIRVVKHWTRLPREVVEYSSLEVPLNIVLGNLLLGGPA